MERSFWQKEGEHHGFDEYGRQLDEAKRAIQVSAAAAVAASDCPVFHDVTYDPGHTDADWAGLVRKRAIKRHIEVPSSLEASAEGGLTTTAAATMHGEGSRRKELPQQRSRAMEFLSHGTAPAWKTTYQLQAEGEPTPKDLLGEEHARRRQRRCGGKSYPTMPPPPPPVPVLPVAPAGPTQEQQDDEDGLLGFRATPATWGGHRTSLLTGLGAKVREGRK